MTTQDAIRILQRIAQGVERIGPPVPPENEIKSADAYKWNAASGQLVAVAEPHYIDSSLLIGIDNQRDTLLANTQQFAKGYSANNILLWGARGMGKSSLVKAVWTQVNKSISDPLKRLVLVEIRCEDIATLPQLIDVLRGWVIRQFIIFCDDMSFDEAHHSLKTSLEGGIQSTPDHILFYATSNRHRAVTHESAADHKHASDIVEEKIALFDRFGILLGFHPCPLEIYLSIVDVYATHYKLDISKEDLHQKAFQWMQVRGARSGRVARQFILDLAGKMGKRIS